MAIVIEDHNCGEWPSPRLSVCISECRRCHSSGIPVCFHTHMYTRNRHDAWVCMAACQPYQAKPLNQDKASFKAWSSIYVVHAHAYTHFFRFLYMHVHVHNIHKHPCTSGPHSELCRSGNVEVAGLAYCSRELCITSSAQVGFHHVYCLYCLISMVCLRTPHDETLISISFLHTFHRYYRALEHGSGMGSTHGNGGGSIRDSRFFCWFEKNHGVL